jgi:hypothetical protein
MKYAIAAELNDHGTVLRRNKMRYEQKPNRLIQPVCVSPLFPPLASLRKAAQRHELAQQIQ